MVAVFNKELLSWYLITLKLNETMQNHGNETITHSMTLMCNDTMRIQGYESNRDIVPEEEEEKEKKPDSPWVIYIREKLNEADTIEAKCNWAKKSIYKIPSYLLNSGDNESYLPQLVSIGPYHHGEDHLKDMEHHKWRCLNRLLSRTKQNVKVYLDAMKDLEPKIRESYQEASTINLTSDELCQSMVLDGCFILELFQGHVEGFGDRGYSHYDPVFAMRGIMHSIQRDLIKLENQLPFFVLERLMALQESATTDASNKRRSATVARLALHFFDPLAPNDEPIKLRLRKQDSVKSTAPFNPLLVQGGLHCLDVFRKSLLCIEPKESEQAPKLWRKRGSSVKSMADKRRLQLVQSAIELRAGGIKLRKRETDRFWDIRFEDGILKIPRLLVHDGTKSLFLNLIAFEQCHLDCSNEIIAYVVFMDNLIKSGKDVSYLNSKGIIEHWLGNDEEVVLLFSRLCDEVVFDKNESYLSHLSEEVNHYYVNKWTTWNANFKHVYFKNPWAIISLLAGILLLVLTFLQALYSILPYYNPIN